MYPAPDPCNANDQQPPSGLIRENIGNDEFSDCSFFIDASTSTIATDGPAVEVQVMFHEPEFSPLVTYIWAADLRLGVEGMLDTQIFSKC